MCTFVAAWAAPQSLAAYWSTQNLESYQPRCSMLARRARGRTVLPGRAAIRVALQTTGPSVTTRRAQRCGSPLKNVYGVTEGRVVSRSSGIFGR